MNEEIAINNATDKPVKSSNQIQNDPDEKIKNNLELFRNLNSLCKSIGLCLRCQLRYLGELYSSTSFVLTQRELKEKINQKLELPEQDEDESVKRFKNDTFCYCCIGLLVNGCEDTEIDKVLNKVSTFNYKFKDFQIHLLLPVPIIIREHIVYAKLFNKFQELENHLKDCYKIKDVYKFILIRKISKATDAKFNVNSKTEISVETEYGNTRIECMELYDKCKNQFNLKSKQKFETIFGQPNVNKALTNLGIKGLLGFKLNKPDRSINIKAVTITNQSLYLVGRYNKYSRDISQTPWVVNDKVKRESLEEIISKELKKYIACEKTKFMASGREDVDVRMLGRGRPFLIEIVHPELLDIDKSVFPKIKNDVKIASQNDVNLNDLQFGDKQDITKYLKQGEMEKKKIYKALCVSTRPIELEDIEKLNSIKDLTIEQDTPIRVLHRRNLSTRPKIIHDLQIELIDNEKYKFNLKLTTEAGTYVKEFVNSDFGRTSPSLGTILGKCETDILELDVLEVCSDWPAKIDTEN